MTTMHEEFQALAAESPAFPVDLARLTWTDLGAIATIVAAIVAIVTLIILGKDSANKTRPYVIVETRVPRFAHKRYLLVLRNSGQTPARDVQVTFDPPLKEYAENEVGGRTTHFIAKRYESPIATFGPGQELSNVVVIDPDEKPHPFPLDVTITLRYKRWSGWGRYKEVHRIQGETIINHTETHSSRELEPRVQKLTSALGTAGNKIANALSKLADSVETAMSDPDDGEDA